MDMAAVATAVALAKGTVLPKTNPEDSGAVLTVNALGEWEKGEPITATISVTNHRLVVTN